MNTHEYTSAHHFCLVHTYLKCHTWYSFFTEMKSYSNIQPLFFNICLPCYTWTYMNPLMCCHQNLNANKVQIRIRLLLSEGSIWSWAILFLMEMTWSDSITLVTGLFWKCRLIWFKVRYDNNVNKDELLDKRTGYLMWIM